MKTGSFTPNPGDLFQWHYDSTDILCHKMEHMWSTPMKCFVELHGINLLVSLTKTDMWWLNNNCIMHTQVDVIDVAVRIGDGVTRLIHPRVDDTVRVSYDQTPRGLHPRKKI